MKAVLGEKPDITDLPEQSRKKRKIQTVTKWCRHDNFEVMDTNFELLCCHDIEDVEYCKLLGVRYMIQMSSHKSFINLLAK